MWSRARLLTNLHAQNWLCYPINATALICTDPGDALWLTDPNRESERRQEPGGVHVCARRITGGAARLVDALAATLPQGCIRLGRGC